MTDPNTLADLRSALAVIPADCGYDVWQRLGSALKPLGNEGRALFLEWSYRSQKAQIEPRPELKWEQLRADRTNHRAIFNEAKKHGWDNPGFGLVSAAESAKHNYDALRDSNGYRFVPGVGLVNHTAIEPRYKLLSGMDLKALAPIRWRIKGIVPDRGLAVLYGPSTAGKSFLAFDMGCAIAEGREWFGYRTRATKVVYLALEGLAGLRNRAAAWEYDNGRELPDNFRVILDSFKLTNSRDIEALIEACSKGCVLIIDTLARAGDDDENDPKSRAEIISASWTLQNRTDAVVILIAHTGKDETRGLRGTKSLTDTVDASIFVNRKDGARAWRADKVKDGRDHVEHGFRLNVVTLGEDEDGDPITSCTIEPEGLPPRGQHRALAEQHADELFLKLLAEFTAQGRTVSAQPASRTHAALVFSKTPIGKQFKRAGFEAAMERLFSSNRIRIEQVGPPSKRKEIVVAVECPSDLSDVGSDLFRTASDIRPDPGTDPVPTGSDPLPSDLPP